MSKLTAAQVKHAKQGPKTWLLRYKHQRRERWMGLGSVEFVTLAQAREKAAEHRRRLKHDRSTPSKRAGRSRSEPA